jgi:hypothetical protein
MIFVCLLLGSISFHKAYYTNTNYYHEITGRGTVVYGATSGGCVAYDYTNERFEVLTNADGLLTNSQSCVGLDSSGFVWVGSSSGLILVDTLFTTVHIYPAECLTCTKIQEIVCRKDSVYVGSSAGLLFINTKGTPNDFADDGRVRIFEANGLPSGNVSSIAVDDTLVWVGTSAGLVHFNKDFTSPVQYDESDGLLSPVVNKVVVIDSVVYVGTDLGLQSFTGDHFDTLLLQYRVNDITSVGDSLALALDSLNQFGFFFGGSITIAKSGIPYLCKVHSLANVNGMLFCGLGNRYVDDAFGEGVGTYDFNSSSWFISKRNCIPSNHIVEITANEQGVFTAHGTRQSGSRGIGWMKRDDTWEHFSSDSVLPTNFIHRCTTAPDGRVWFAVNPFVNDTSSVMLLSFDPEQETWQFINNGYNGMDGAVAVWDIAFDRDGTMYLTLAGPSDRLWVIDSSLTTPYALGERTPGFNCEIAVDSSARIWSTVAGAEGGLIMVDTRGTLFDRNDDVYEKFTQSDGLLSRDALGCAVGFDGVLYVANGTDLLTYDEGTFSGLAGLSSADHFDVELDSQGRIWVMTRDGVYYFDPELNTSDGWRYSDLGIQIRFLESSNELIQVQGFTFDAERHCFWLGGETGLLQLEIQSDSTSLLDSVTIFPNPVVGHNIVRIGNIPDDSRVTIYSLAGRKVAENLVPDPGFGEVVWLIPDGVASGVYVALIQSDRYGKTVSKFAIVR